MEGQVSPTTGDDPAGDDPPLRPPKALLTQRSAGPSHETYVIQIPKNQVYRVPPPENALIAERFRKGPETNKAKKPRLSRRLLISIVVLIVFIIIAITMLVLYLVLSPKGPKFSVIKVVVVIKNSKSSTTIKNKHPRPSYEISLLAKNPNTRTGFDYETSEDVSLLFGGKEIANGKFPAFHQERDNSTKLKLVLSSSNNAGLPHGMEKTMNETKSKEPVSLVLEMDVKMKMEFWIMKTWTINFKTNCDFKVISTLGPDSRVVSQKCHCKYKR